MELTIEKTIKTFETIQVEFPMYRKDTYSVMKINSETKAVSAWLLNDENFSLDAYTSKDVIHGKILSYETATEQDFIEMMDNIFKAATK